MKTKTEQFNPWHSSPEMGYMCHAFCAQCDKRDRGAGSEKFRPGCDIQAQAEWAGTAHEAKPPKEWIAEDGKPRCTAFVEDLSL